MTKQQLREAIRRIIKQELNETVTGTEAEEIAKQAGSYEAAVDALIKLGTSFQYSNAIATEIYGEKVNEGSKTVSNPNAGKWRIVTSDKEKPLTDKFYDSKAEAEEASRKIGKTNAPGIKIIQLKDTMKVFAKENAPAPSKPAPTTKPTVAPGKPAEKQPRRPLGNPNVQPGPKAKATMKEAEMLKQVIKRFKSKK